MDNIKHCMLNIANIDNFSVVLFIYFDFDVL